MNIEQCGSCHHFIGSLKCAAFPGGIPQDILDGALHENPRKGDRGLVFKKRAEIQKAGFGSRLRDLIKAKRRKVGEVWTRGSGVTVIKLKDGKIVPVKSGRGRAATEEEKPEEKPSAAGQIGDLLLEDYSEKALIVRGNTKGNLEYLRELKQQLNTGIWNRKAGGWIFPKRYMAQIQSYLQSKLEQDADAKGEAISQEEKDSAAGKKNAVAPGTEVDVGGRRGVVVQVVSGDPITYQVIYLDGDVENVAESDLSIIPKKDSKDIEDTTNDATPGTRPKTEKELFGQAPANQIEDATEVVPFSPGTSEIHLNFSLWTKGYSKVQYEDANIEVKDYTSVPPDTISLADPKTILDDERPSYIPEIDEDYFERSRHRIEAVKLGEDRYVISGNSNWQPGTSSRIGGEFIETGGNPEYTKFTVVSRDVLAATQHYYMTLADAKNKAKIAERRERYIKQIMDNNGYSREDAEAASKRRIPNSRLKKMPYKKVVGTIGDKTGVWIETKVSHSHQSAIKLLLGRLDSEEYKKNIFETLKDMDIRLNDMTVQKEYDNSFQKGLETSWGDTGTNDSIQDSHGVLVKRQNGTEISQPEIDQISGALDQLWSVYGNRSEMSRKFGLKISHSGGKRMFARTAVGIYSERYKAIGVSALQGDAEFGLTLGHEFAHFMDNYLGKSSGKGRRFDSDDPSSTAGAIASQFRDSMTDAVSANKYWNRTCECFARALEQYTAHQTGSKDNYKDRPYYVPTEQFESKIKPLIEKFLAEKNEMLKAMGHRIVVSGDGKIILKAKERQEGEIWTQDSGRRVTKEQGKIIPVSESKRGQALEKHGQKKKRQQEQEGAQRQKPQESGGDKGKKSGDGKHSGGQGVKVQKSTSKMDEIQNELAKPAQDGKTHGMGSIKTDRGQLDGVFINGKPIPGQQYLLHGKSDVEVFRATPKGTMEKVGPHTGSGDYGIDAARMHMMVESGYGLNEIAKKVPAKVIVGELGARRLGSVYEKLPGSLQEHLSNLASPGSKPIPKRESLANPLNDEEKFKNRQKYLKDSIQRYVDEAKEIQEELKNPPQFPESSIEEFTSYKNVAKTLFGKEPDSIFAQKDSNGNPTGMTVMHSGDKSIVASIKDGKIQGPVLVAQPAEHGRTLGDWYEEKHSDLEQDEIKKIMDDAGVDPNERIAETTYHSVENNSETGELELRADYHEDLQDEPQGMSTLTGPDILDQVNEDQFTMGISAQSPTQMKREWVERRKNRLQQLADDVRTAKEDLKKSPAEAAYGGRYKGFDMFKAKGAGSRGGIIIGYTRTGQPIYLGGVRKKKASPDSGKGGGVRDIAGDVKERDKQILQQQTNNHRQFEDEARKRNRERAGIKDPKERMASYKIENAQNGDIVRLRNRGLSPGGHIGRVVSRSGQSLEVMMPSGSTHKFTLGDLEIAKAQEPSGKYLTEADLNRYAAKTNTNPTESQKESGKYRKARFKIHGIPVAIENPAGSMRRGRSADGKEWESKLAHHYGYFEGFTGADGDEVDVFIGPNPESEIVYVVNQTRPGGDGFDEHKVMLGFTNREAARKGYLANYKPDWKGLGSIASMTINQLTSMLQSGSFNKRPIPVGGLYKAQDGKLIIKAKKRDVGEEWTQDSGQKVKKVAPGKIVPVSGGGGTSSKEDDGKSGSEDKKKPEESKPADARAKMSAAIKNLATKVKKSSGSDAKAVMEAAKGAMKTVIDLFSGVHAGTGGAGEAAGALSQSGQAAKSAAGDSDSSNKSDSEREKLKKKDEAQKRQDSSGIKWDKWG